uniref:Restriction alleviation protein, Lar family n=1 Tax=Serratia phage Kevin TaxID=3161161 RepID=A0AAU8KWS5_9CAUD
MGSAVQDIIKWYKERNQERGEPEVTFIDPSNGTSVFNSVGVPVHLLNALIRPPRIKGLKPCPFCSHPPLETINGFKRNGTPVITVSCTRCDIKMSGVQSTTRRRWNTRP